MTRTHDLPHSRWACEPLRHRFGLWQQRNKFLILQDKHNIRTLSFNIKLIYTRCETCQKGSSKLAFLPASKARTNKLYIFRQCTYIVYIFFQTMYVHYIFIDMYIYCDNVRILYIYIYIYIYIFCDYVRISYIYIYIYKSRRLCNDTDKGVTKNILTKFSINKWPSSVSIKVRLSL